MTLRTFIIGSVLTSFVSAGILIVTITQLNPYMAGAIGFILFFMSLFVLLSSVVAVIGYVIRRLIFPRHFPTYLVRTSVRHGLMTGLFVDILLFLQLLRLYRWWISIIVIAIFISFELIFFSYDRASRDRLRPKTNDFPRQ